MHLTPAGFPPGIPGIGDEIDKAMQQAPQPSRQIIKKINGINVGKAQGRSGAMAQWLLLVIRVVLSDES